ncbi:hypothetical protein PF010_g32197 [Phytophthora fragariae]|uniref:Uncharacterized protein n=1 Tax=Phytophthora fragariae TaxID=53985 RepID=A0A6G0JG41_9STRA|nr:hypothetical protein PF010_g32197 [Phytophthora fragariae]KAE9158300.1 hypothetical protein PF004_g31925 [Phytophthora fragariae]
MSQLLHVDGSFGLDLGLLGWCLAQQLCLLCDAGRLQPTKAQRLPPPCVQHSPLEIVVFWQSATEHLVPPPCDQHSPRDLAPRVQPPTVQSVEPPCFQQRPRCLALAVQPGMEQDLPPPWRKHRPRSMV